MLFEKDSTRAFHDYWFRSENLEKIFFTNLESALDSVFFSSWIIFTEYGWKFLPRIDNTFPFVNLKKNIYERICQTNEMKIFATLDYWKNLFSCYLLSHFIYVVTSMRMPCSY